MDKYDFYYSQVSESVINLEDDSLESFLNKKGLRLANASDTIQIQQAAWRVFRWNLSPMHLFGKYISDPINDATNWAKHTGRCVFDRQYALQYDHAVKVCQQEKFPFQVYSKKEIDDQVRVVASLSEQIGPILGNQMVAGLNVVAAVGSLREGPPLLQAINMLSATFASTQAYGSEAQKIKADFSEASAKLRRMVEMNQDAS